MDKYRRYEKLACVEEEGKPKYDDVDAKKEDSRFLEDENVISALAMEKCGFDQASVKTPKLDEITTEISVEMENDIVLPQEKHNPSEEESCYTDALTLEMNVDEQPLDNVEVETLVDKDEGEQHSSEVESLCAKELVKAVSTVKEIDMNGIGVKNVIAANMVQNVESSQEKVSRPDQVPGQTETNSYPQKEVDQGGSCFILGAKPKKQNSLAQSKKHAKEKKKDEPSLIQPSNQTIFRQIFGANTIRKDWSLFQGIIGEVLEQNEDYCWAIVFARLMQALYNQGLHVSLHHEFSFLELVEHIKPKNTNVYSLANLKIAFDHISKHGMLKKPLKKRDERASSKGVRIQKNFHLCEDVDAAFIRGKVDKYPVGLILESTAKFIRVGEGFYYLPKKTITQNSRLHTLIIIGYGITTQGDLYFIGQNSWGDHWGCRGYVRIIIKEKCDIICLKE